MKMTLSEIAGVLKTEAPAGSERIAVTGVCFDTRKLKEGDLFIPLEGTRDGHDFIATAEQKGAAASLFAIGHDAVNTKLPLLEVRDPLRALQDLARYYLLMKVNPKVVAITGSNGKTTTKDMCAAVLSSQYNVVKTQDNFNNEIGVPMTILSMETNTEVLVVEMGMDRPGQLDFLSKMAAPDVAVITMIGEAHIEFFKTRDRIADAKMEIVNGLKEDGLFIYNGDEPLLRERAKNVQQASKTFGLSPENDLYARNINAKQTSSDFDLSKWPDLHFEIPIMGEYNVSNALAAILVGRRFHIKPEAIQKALKTFRATDNRTQWLRGDNGEMILSDVYNANPTADAAVLGDFANFPTKSRRIAVLGDMLELGDASKDLHAGLASSLNPHKISDVYLYGDDMRALADKLKDVYAPEHLHYYAFGSQPELITQLADDVRADDLVLLKGSHGMHLETVLTALQATERE
ncbi:UDP-N-acetylmuramoyl-tripeptide--D-alanyl-D-alanine ligase [Lacticaseibacillus zhaodongensis]|uniref:UDP-N-acetylmuramoyl-tripeptide--D-alanyl-D- alanine ligase n=1 Tax=Lacticaseibacillus zhaodongensis TaxID=2668065 RepID=UPI0012D2AD4D|nr:UDP-N-acetylmuramoyl-tripeptide--D-alanyl-D-alanine ligase [Lacticaseibacillus zhaodongensis]